MNKKIIIQPHRDSEEAKAWWKAQAVKDPACPKLIKDFKTKNFSDLTTFNKKGEKIGFEESLAVSDRGEFEREVYAVVDIQILTQELSPKQKDAVIKRAEDDISRKQDAAREKVSQAAIKRRRYLAYQKIREKIARVKKNQLAKFGKNYE